MIAKRAYLLILSFTALAISGFSQEVVTGLQQNTQIYDRQGSRDMTKSLAEPDTTGLPFFEDFIPLDIWPSEMRWTDNDVYINNTYPVNPVSQGVATFDAIDNNGLLYDEAGAFSFEADHLTSVPIDLDLDPSDNVFLSFFYQPQGIADAPEQRDSLVLQFYSVADEQWHHIWKAEGTGLHNFKPVIIKIDNPDYLYKGFRFRFINYASISTTIGDPAMAGNSDHWHIDYIYLNRNRSAADTIPADVAFTSPVRSVLNTYESMPWSQFRNVFLSEMGSYININYRNNDGVTRNVTRNFEIKDLYEDEVVHTFSAGATNIEPGQWISYDANLIYTFNSSQSDSALFRIRSVLITDEFDRKINDTIEYLQVFGDYFAYDDGSAESGYGINGQGASNAKVSVRFRSFEPDTLRAVRMAFNDSYQSLNRRYFNIAIWDDDNGMPGELLYEQEEMIDPGQTVNGFIEYILNDPTAIDDYFHIGWIQQSETFLNVSLDLNTPPEGRRYYYINGIWNESEAPGSLMIRPVTGKAIIPSDIDDTMISEKGNISIWPNPVKDILNIDISAFDTVREPEISIYGNDGRLIMTMERTDRIDVSSLPRGIYIIIIKTGNHTLGYNKFIRL